jgi:hypothetical protein
VHVIQRGVSGAPNDISDGEEDIAEAKGLRTACCSAGGVFGGAEEPVEGNDREVADMLVGATGDWVIDIEERPEITDNWYVGGIGSFGWVILVTEPFEESSE